jgi:PAS domain S-box-containing protein
MSDRASGEKAPSAGPADAKRIRVLLVEDDETDFVIFKGVLAKVRGTDFDLEWASSLDAGLEKLETGVVDIVLLDYRLGRGADAPTGLDFIRESKRRELGAPIILLTGTGSHDVDIKAMELGAVDYIPKEELAPRLLERSIRYGMDRHRAQNEIRSALARVKESRRDLLSILNQLRHGTAITDAEGRVAFISDTAQRLTGHTVEEALGRSWEALFEEQPNAVEALRAAVKLEAAQRRKVAASGRSAGGPAAELEVEVVDDPREDGRKIFVFYDVSEVHRLRRAVSHTAQFHGLIGQCPAMQAVYEQIRDVADVDATVLVEGKTGTGKELVARAIHFSGRRKEGPFIPVNCAGLTESLVASQLFGHRRGAFTGAVENNQGLFEAAEHGTLFLDEIGDVPMSVQTTLLRVLQDKQVTRVGDTRARAVDVRFVAASQKDLQAEVEAGRFRADLLYRIRVARVTLPPLRERSEDIPLLCQRFLDESRTATGKAVEGFTEGAMRSLTGYGWPGNVREMRSAVESAVIRCKRRLIGAEDLPPEIPRVGAEGPDEAGALLVRGPLGDDPAGGSVPAASGAASAVAPVDERTRILQALDQAGGNRTRAARIFGVSRATFYRRLKELGIETKQN